MIIDDLFIFKTGSLPALEKTEEGDVPLVYGTTYNNGVIKHVKADTSQIFLPPLITVSYLGTAFVQIAPFTTSVVDKSNIIILEPKDKNMPLEQLYFYAYQINRVAKFGFHYGRRMNMRQLKKLIVLPFGTCFKKIDFVSLLPVESNCGLYRKTDRNIIFREHVISAIFNLVRGDFHAIDRLDKGTVPTVSRTSFDNGVVGYFEPPDDATVYDSGCLTISTVSGEAFVQIDKFIATDNIVICVPKTKLELTTLVFIQLMLNRQKWRYSYGRQCYKTKFEKTSVYLPTTSDGKLDEKFMQQVVENTPYWDYVVKNIKKEK